MERQPEKFREIVTRHDLVPEVLARAAELALPSWYLTAGRWCQTVRNVVTGRPPAEGSKDYDLFSFDDSDLSWDAENAVIEEGARRFADLPASVEIRNDARVHLWYEDRFGVLCAPYSSTEAAIDSRRLAWGSGWPAEGSGRSTRRTGSRTCSPSSSGPVPATRRRAVTRRKPGADKNNGRS